MKIKEVWDFFFPAWYIEGFKKLSQHLGTSVAKGHHLWKQWAKVNREGRHSVCRRTTQGGSLGPDAWPTVSRWPELKVPVESHNLSQLKPGELVWAPLPGLEREKLAPNGEAGERRTWGWPQRYGGHQRYAQSGAGELLQMRPQLNKLSLNLIQFPRSPSNPHIFLKKNFFLLENSACL